MKNLYAIYEVCAKNRCSDLVIALAMFEAEHPLPNEESQQLREFIGRHGAALAEAFPERAAFDAAVAAGEAEDAATAEV